MSFTRFLGGCLSDWLAWQETLHPSSIDLSLDRLAQVLAKLNWQQPKCPVITVGGTNGKGSCVALLASILEASGYRVGTFTSPHLVRYNERIKIAAQEISDASLIAAFERIDVARGDISLTFFEFNTLAALLIFDTAGLDAMVLEVGLGGRLDAVNIVDADVAIIVSVALDHCDWLGNDVESIGREKAGIFRRDRFGIFGSPVRPQSIVTEASRIGTQLLSLNSEYSYHLHNDEWDWQGRAQHFINLPRPNLAGDVQIENAAAVLAALECVNQRLPVPREAIDIGLQSIKISGRFDIINSNFGLNFSEWILDVAHNPAAAATLAHNLAARFTSGRTIAICGMFADKDVDGVIAAVCDHIDLWIITGVTGSRALGPTQLAARVASHGGVVTNTVDEVATACTLAQTLAQPSDRIVVFGSFHTVGPALAWLNAGNKALQTQ